jgi:hypothetical protein
MSNVNILPQSIVDLIGKLQDTAIPQDKRQNYRKTLEDIRIETGKAIVRFDAECLQPKAKKTSRR